MKYKAGQVLYSATVWKGKVDVDEWVVRTIRGGRVHAIIKTSFTWVKLSNKHFDWGWAKDIPSYARRSCIEGGKFNDIYTTKLAALKSELKSGYVDEEDKPAIRSRITREKNK